MIEDTMNMSEASDLLDTDFNQDIEAMGREYTLLAIKKINRTPTLYTDVKNGIVDDAELTVDNIAQTCYDYAEMHNNEFGDLFQSDLDLVDWDEVIRRV